MPLGGQSDKTIEAEAATISSERMPAEEAIEAIERIMNDPGIDKPEEKIAALKELQIYPCTEYGPYVNACLNIRNLAYNHNDWARLTDDQLNKLTEIYHNKDDRWREVKKAGAKLGVLIGFVASVKTLGLYGVVMAYVSMFFGGKEYPDETPEEAAEALIESHNLKSDKSQDEYPYHYNDLNRKRKLTVTYRPQYKKIALVATLK